MSFNNSFDDNDSCELVAIGLGLKEYRCGWIVNGLPCNAPVLGQDFPTHLKTVHRTNDTLRPECQWGGCRDVLNKECLVRHVQEKHLEYRWPCPNPKCDRIFTRRGVLEGHRNVCTA